MFNWRNIGIILGLAALVWLTSGDWAWAADNADDGKLFSALLESGRKIFSDLRELIYIVAGFGFIAVGVGGIFGNLNWKWFGAIIISLVVIATADELIKWMTDSNAGVSNTLTRANAQAAGIESNSKYTANANNFEDTLKAVQGE